MVIQSPVHTAEKKHFQEARKEVGRAMVNNEYLFHKLSPWQQKKDVLFLLVSSTDLSVAPVWDSFIKVSIH